MRYPDRELDEVSSLLGELRDHCAANGTITWYRGQPRADWSLVPSIARPPRRIDAEAAMIKRFKQNAASHLTQRPLNDWEWIFLMQHYRAPTRLLDWSESPLAALFFALFDSHLEHEDEPGALWFLDPIRLNINANQRRVFELDIPAAGIDVELDQYLPDQVSARRVNPDPVAIIGPKNSARMVAQAGTFTIMHYETKPIEQIGDGQHIWRMIIPPRAKALIREELVLLGITEYTLFPDLDRVSLAIRNLIG